MSIHCCDDVCAIVVVNVIHLPINNNRVGLLFIGSVLLEMIADFCHVVFDGTVFFAPLHLVADDVL